MYFKYYSNKCLDSNLKIPKILHLSKTLDGQNIEILDNFAHQAVSETSQADFVVISIHRRTGDNLNEFDAQLKEVAESGKIILCTNPDTTIPADDKLNYCPGYFAKKIEDFGGNVIYCGKPKPEIYQETFSRIIQTHGGTIDKSKIIMIGDTIANDILGANSVGIDSALVSTGNCRKLHENFISLSEKISNIKQHADKAGAKPTFFTTLIDEIYE